MGGTCPESLRAEIMNAFRVVKQVWSLTLSEWLRNNLCCWEFAPKCFAVQAQGTATMRSLVHLRKEEGEPSVSSSPCQLGVICMSPCKCSRLHACVLTGDLGKGVESDRRHAEPVH